MGARLGNVVYWFCSIFASLVAMLIVYIALFGEGALSVWHYFVGLLVLAMVWGFGWSVRYVLRG